MKLAQLNGKRIAVEVMSQGHKDVILGTGKYVRRKLSGAGAYLRIAVDDWVKAGVVAFILHEQKWNGDVEVDMTHGCDYRVCLDRAEGLSEQMAGER